MDSIIHYLPNIYLSKPDTYCQNTDIVEVKLTIIFIFKINI